MRAGLVLLVALMAGCSKEPDFDERFEVTERRIAEKAAVMERDLQAQEGRDTEPALSENK
jgi:hypothetical protein